MKKLTIEAPKDGFKDDQFASQCEVSFADTVIVSCFFLTIMGLPLALVGTFFVLLVFGSWTSLLIIFPLVSAFFALHPLPKATHENNFNPFIARLMLALFRYFSYRHMFSGDALEKAQSGEPWIGAAPPHGALPIANMLCWPSFNLYHRAFIGATADVVRYTPGMRYLLILGSCSVSGSSMAGAVNKGLAVGMNPDGIAGIFTANEYEEIVALKSRKGLARLMLRTGTALSPAYSMGNAAAFKVWYDRWGIMELLSRKLKVSLFIPYGRWGLPIPFRVNVTLLFAEPIRVQKVPEGTEPTESQVDELHQRILDEMSALFAKHKSSLGFQKSSLKFV